MAGRILAEAVLLSGRQAAYSQVFGPESRGGASRADVVISEGEIGFPLAEALDVLVTLSQEALERYRPDLRDEALLLMDAAVPSNMPPGPWEQWILPIVETARRVTSNPLVTGVVALGTLEGIAALVGPEALERSVAARVPPDHLDLNLRALAAGMQLSERESRP
jgi:2-oxoglutarate ferredoxin oxidoreductase subunit gamma